MTYQPIPVAQADGSRFQWGNCNCAVGATNLDRDTRGKHRTTGGRVRALTGDTVGGTTHEQVDGALRKGWPPDDHYDVRRMLPFDDFVEEVESGRGAGLAIRYSVFSGTALDGSPGFRGNHEIQVNDVTIVRYSTGHIDYSRSSGRIYDPLWNARRAGIPPRAYQNVTLGTLRRAAGLLELSPGRTVGAGYCYCAFTRDTEPTAPKPTPQPIVGIKYGRNAMIVGGGLTFSSSHVMALKAGQALYRENRADKALVVTRMAKAGKVAYFGNAGNGMKAVRVVTGNFSDGKNRPVIVYVPAAAGVVTAL